MLLKFYTIQICKKLLKELLAGLQRVNVAILSEFLFSSYSYSDLLSSSYHDGLISRLFCSLSTASLPTPPPLLVAACKSKPLKNLNFSKLVILAKSGKLDDMLDDMLDVILMTSANKELDRRS